MLLIRLRLDYICIQKGFNFKIPLFYCQQKLFIIQQVWNACMLLCEPAVCFTTLFGLENPKFVYGFNIILMIIYYSKPFEIVNGFITVLVQVLQL